MGRNGGRRKGRCRRPEESSVETREISEGVLLDYDAKGNLVGIDIDNASSKVELKELILSKLPGTVRTVAA